MKLIYAIRSQGHSTLGRRLGSDWNETRVGLFRGLVMFFFLTWVMVSQLCLVQFSEIEYLIDFSIQ